MAKKKYPTVFMFSKEHITQYENNRSKYEENVRLHQIYADHLNNIRKIFQQLSPQKLPCNKLTVDIEDKRKPPIIATDIDSESPRKSLSCRCC